MEMKRLGEANAWIRWGLGLVAAVLITALIWWILHRYIGPGSASEKTELVKTLAQIIGGIVVLIGLYFTGRTLSVNREGQITERFTRAIDLIGAPDVDGKRRMESRLGGIYALVRIARDSERDYWPIIEVLTAYVRLNASWFPDGDGPDPLRTPADIQAILTALVERAHSYGNGEHRPINLSRTDLRLGELDNVHLEAGDLRTSCLRRVGLREAHLEKARLEEARLEGAHLEGAHLEGAYLGGAHMHGTHLKGTHLEGARLGRALGLTHKQLEQAITDEATVPPYELQSDQ